MNRLGIFLISIFQSLIIANCVISSGCPMSNCDNSLSNLQFVSESFNFQPKLLWRDNKNIKGSNSLGCIGSTNNVICVDSYSFSHVSYNYSGQVNWKYQSQTYSNESTVGWTNENGFSLITSPNSQNQTFVLLSDKGQILWSVNGGCKFNTLFTSLGMFVSVMSDGVGLLTILANGQTFSSLEFPYEINGKEGRFIIISTPSAKGNRVYLQSLFQSSSSLNSTYHAVIAVDLFNSETNRMKIAWIHVYEGEYEKLSGVSVNYLSDENKTYLLFSLLNSNSSYTVFCLEDKNNGSNLVWTKEMKIKKEERERIEGGGVFGFSFGEENFLFSYMKGGNYLNILSVLNGEEIGKLEYSKVLGLINDTYLTSEINYLTSISQPNNQLLFAVSCESEKYVVSISFDSNQNTPSNFQNNMKFNLGKVSDVLGQFNLVFGQTNNQQSIVFSTKEDGIFSIGI